nr:TonB-dependent receptor plug domain-containing protein [Helicobacter saguini]
MEKKPFKDLAEALSEIPGIDVATQQGRMGGLGISIRGMPSTYTLILIDGKRQSVAENVNSSNNTGKT